MTEYIQCPDCGLYIIKEVVVCPYCATPVKDKDVPSSSAS